VSLCRKYVPWSTGTTSTRCLRNVLGHRHVIFNALEEAISGIPAWKAFEVQLRGITAFLSNRGLRQRFQLLCSLTVPVERMFDGWHKEHVSWRWEYLEDVLTPLMGFCQTCGAVIATILCGVTKARLHGSVADSWSTRQEGVPWQDPQDHLLAGRTLQEPRAQHYFKCVLSDGVFFSWPRRIVEGCLRDASDIVARQCRGEAKSYTSIGLRVASKSFHLRTCPSCPMPRPKCWRHRLLAESAPS
jgi:hypothetical protein